MKIRAKFVLNFVIGIYLTIISNVCRRGVGLGRVPPAPAARGERETRRRPLSPCRRRTCNRRSARRGHTPPPPTADASAERKKSTEEEGEEEERAALGSLGAAPPVQFSAPHRSAVAVCQWKGGGEWTDDPLLRWLELRFLRSVFVCRCLNAMRLAERDWIERECRIFYPSWRGSYRVSSLI